VRYAEATRFLYGLAPRGVQLGLSRMERALRLRGEPQRAVKAVIVAGTNGKGSVASMLASVLRASGLRVGLYTSPHLHRMTERFSVDGKAISQRELARRVTELAPFLTDRKTPELTFFEACTLLAFEHFRDAGCDINVLEVGLGGRLDATNVVTPLVGVITAIGLDHQDRLGATKAEIAREKAGIIKRSVPIVVGTRDSEALAAIADIARKRRARLLCIERDFSVAAAEAGLSVTVHGHHYDGLPLALVGAHQADNLACAVAAVHQLRQAGFTITEPALRRGLRNTRWPGRLELLSGRPALLLDAAHNPEACAQLAAYLKVLPGTYTRRVLLFGVMRDKDHAQMMRQLLPVVDAVVFATPDTPRAESAEHLAARYGGAAVGDPTRALALAEKLAGRRGLVVAAGSIFLMARARAARLGLGMDPTIAM